MTPDALLALLHICDTLFPTGAFAHSDGLEAATSDGRVCDGAALREWLEASLDDALARCEAPGLLLARRAFVERDWAAIRAIDAEVHAMRPSAASRRASLATGARLLKMWQQLHSAADFARAVEAIESEYGTTFPVAFGLVSASAGIEEEPALSGFLYVRLAAAVSAAMRLMPIGQHEAHAVLAAVLERVPAAVAHIRAHAARPCSFAPAMDLAVMSHQYVHSRLFRS